MELPAWVAPLLRIGELRRRLVGSDHVFRAGESRYGLLQPVRLPGVFGQRSWANAAFDGLLQQGGVVTVMAPSSSPHPACLAGSDRGRGHEEIGLVPFFAFAGRLVIVGEVG